MRFKMFETFAVIQIIICLLLVVVILLQEGKKGMGAIFGGSSSSIFGARGAGNILTKVTSVLAILFMLNSVWMSYISSRDASVIDEIKTTEESKEPSMEPAPVKEEKAEEPVKEEAPANKEEAPANKEEAPAE
jgi:preprotein translocase subunit SecG